MTSSSVSSGSASVNYSSLSGNSPLNLRGAVNNGTGPVTYNVESTAINTTVTIQGNGGDETVNVSPTAMNLDNIRGNVVFVGGGGADAIRVNDQTNTNNDSLVVTDSSVRRDRSAAIVFGYTSMSRTINGGTGNNSVTVTGLPINGSLSLNTGGGSDLLIGPNAAKPSKSRAPTWAASPCPAASR